MKKQTNLKKVKNCLLIGLLGALLTVIAEFLQGFVPSTDTTDQLSKLFSSFYALPDWRIGIGATLGAVGILLQFFGLYAISLRFINPDHKAAKCYRAGMYLYAVLGAFVHILLSAMIYLYKVSYSVMLDFLIWFVLPSLLVFLAGYLLFSLAMLWLIGKGHTPYPKWLWVCNPLCGKLFITAVTAFLPPTALVNGIAYADMGISALLIFLTFLLLSKDVKK